ncbi:MAG: site-specific integrase [Dehalococcoidia bacterium]|nr:site-specific integrase [Dehalococcoidia bacterium]
MKRNELIVKFQKELTIRNYSPNTQRAYLSGLQRFLEFYDRNHPDSISGDFLKNYLLFLKEDRHYSYSSLKHALATLRFLYEIVLDQKVNFDFDLKIRKTYPLPEVLSVPEVRSLFEKTLNLKHKTILMTIYACGLRISEAVNLRVSDIDSERMLVRIAQGKGRKDRLVILPANLLIVLRRYCHEYHPEEFLFEGTKGGQYSTRSIQALFRRAVKYAKIRKKVSVHSLRHSFATHLLDQGTDIRYIQELLGHKHLSTTQIYTHISNYNLQKIKSPFDANEFQSLV